MRVSENSIPKLVQNALAYYEEAIEGIFDGKRFERFDIQKAEDAIQWCYKKCGYEAPHIIVVENPLEQMLLTEYLELDPLINSFSDMFASRMEMQIYSEISDEVLGPSYFDEGRSYSRIDHYIEDERLYSRINYEIRDKLYQRINTPLYKMIFGAKSHDKIEEAFGKSNFDKAALEVLNFLNVQHSGHLLTSRKINFRFEKEPKPRTPLLEVLSVFSIHYLAFFKFMVEELCLPLSEKGNFRSFYELHRESGIFSCCCSEQIAIICKYPKKVFQKKDNMWELHNLLGSAIEWNYAFAKFGCHYIEGIYLDTERFEKVISRELSYEIFTQIKNDREKAAAITLMKENYGDAELFRVFNPRLVDETEVLHGNNYVETIKIYQTKGCYSFLSNRWGEINKPFAWIEFTCPSTQKKHLILTCPEFKKAIDAARWHRPDFLPEDIPYKWTKAY